MNNLSPLQLIILDALLETLTANVCSYKHIATTELLCVIILYQAMLYYIRYAMWYQVVYLFVSPHLLV